MNYLQIKSFLKTIELGSMTQAANALFISQSTLSGRINKLEEELGVELFSRGHGSKGVILTEEGLSFLEYAKKYISLLDDIEKRKNKSNVRLEISISGPHSVNSFFLDDFYKKYTDSNQIKLNISSHWNHTIYNMIDTFELDLGIVSRPYGSNHLLTEEIFKEELYIVYDCLYVDYADIEDPSILEKSNEIHLDWGPDYEIWYQQYWNKAEVPKITVDSPELIIEFLKTEDAWAVMPKCVFNYLKNINRNLRKIDKIESFYRTIYLIKHKKASHVIEGFLDELEKYIDQMEDQGLCISLI